MNEFLTEDFIEEIISMCIRKRNFFESIKSEIKPHFMPNDEFRDIWNEVVYFYETGKRPTYGLLKMNVRKNKDAVTKLSKIKEIPISKFNEEDLIIGLEEYLKRAMFMDMYDNLAKVYNKGDHTKAFANFVKYAEDFSNFSLRSKVEFEKIFGDYDSRNIQRGSETKEYDEVIPLGIPQLDEAMDGGPRRGEATMVTARTGGGKSYMAIHAGISAAKRGIGVAHFQLEGTKKQVMDRYDAAWTGSLYSDVKKGVEAVKPKIASIQKVLKRIKGEIYAKAFEKFEEVTIQEIRNLYYELIKERDIGLIIIDYFELSTPGGEKFSPSEERFRQDKLGKLFKALAVETNTHVLTFTQTGDIPPENYNNPKFVITQHNLSEHRTKIKPFDNHITLNQTDKERKKRRLRVFVDKLRDNDSKKIFFIKQALNYSRFFDSKGTMKLLAELSDEEEEIEIMKSESDD